MINSTCGYDPHCRLTRRGGCGVWVGWMIKEHPWGFPIIPMQPHFRRNIAYCKVCIEGFKVKHVGFGQFVRPKEESDKITVKGPKLEDLY